MKPKSSVLAIATAIEKESRALDGLKHEVRQLGISAAVAERTRHIREPGPDPEKVDERELTLTIVTPDGTRTCELPACGDLALQIEIRLCPYCDRPFLMTCRTQRFDKPNCRESWDRKFGRTEN